MASTRTRDFDVVVIKTLFETRPLPGEASDRNRFGRPVVLHLPFWGPSAVRFYSPRRESGDCTGHIH